MYKFIYVFDAKTADSLVEQGFNLIKSNKEKNIYVFENNPKNTMKLSKKDFVFSNTLTF